MRGPLIRLGFLLLVLPFVFLLQREAAAHDPPSVAKGAQRREIRLPVEDFSLADQTGKNFRFQSLKGKIVVVSFIYTTCPDVCPLITANLRLVQERLTAGERGGISFLSITTDPEVDTPNVLKSYADRYRVDFSNWSFLTGEEKRLQRVWKIFSVKVERKARGLVNHTTLTALIDRKGMMRFAYAGAAPEPKAILEDLRRLLRSQ